jgi:hypothetical protein
MASQPPFAIPIAPSEIVVDYLSEVFDASASTYWALAEFRPTSAVPEIDTVPFQDGNNLAVFTSSDGVVWHLRLIGAEPFCPMAPFPGSVSRLPAAVRTALGYCK